MTRFSAALLGLAFASVAGAAPALPEPLSYAKPTPGGRFVLVVFGSAEAEAKLPDGENKRHSAGVRANYPASGMYRAGDEVPPKLVYPLAGYAPDTNVYLSGDGRYVVRVEGDWWRTRPYPTSLRLAPEVERAQLDAPAVSFFQDGKLRKAYPLKDLITDAAALPHSPDHILWPGAAAFRESDGLFVLDTQDSNRTVFDYRTGEIVEREKMGYGNPFGRRLILVTFGLTLLMALAWALYAFFRFRTRKATARAPLSASPPPGRPLG